MSEARDQLQQEPLELHLTPEEAVGEMAARAAATAARANRRVIIGLAGGPGSGKSTLAAALVGALNDIIDGSAARVPMDGFHMKHEKLEQLDLVERKGAPETFEAHAFIEFIKRLKTEKGAVPAPSYSRKLEDVVPDAFTIAANVPILVVEGNYLLLDRSPWNQIKDLLDMSFYLEVPREIVRKRLLRRHAEHGLFTEQRNLMHVESVDLKNYDLVAAHHRQADIVIKLKVDR